MRPRNMHIYFLLALVLVFPLSAQAANYVIAPFAIDGPAGYSYLSQAIPSTLNTRLAGSGQYEAVRNQASVLNGLAPGNQDAAERIRSMHGADFVIWGQVQVEADQAAVSINVQDSQGLRWQRSGLSSLDNLMQDLNRYADTINVEVFGMPAGSGGMASGNPLRGSSSTSYSDGMLNPEFRYQQNDVARTRTQILEYEGLGFDIADLDRDGVSEILVVTPRYLYAYHLVNGVLQELASHRVPSSLVPIAVRAFEQNGQAYIMISGHDSSGREGASQVLSYAGNNFSVLVNRTPHYLNVLDSGLAGNHLLIGQSGSANEIFSGGIYQMRVDGNRLRRGDKIDDLPREATVMNFAFLPTGGGNVTILALDDKLAVYSGTRRLYRTADMYSASVKGIMPENETIGYYFPIRSVVADVDRNGIAELLAVRPLTTGGQFFHNYRTYPSGEVHALNWDGMSLNVQWKTNQIQGTVIDLCLADADNNGSLELVVQINNYPGGIGLGQVTSALIFYPLDQGLISAN